jgi:crossover junction endodeoxyribonuclease RusA
MSAREWTLDLKRSRPMNLNERTHWRVKAIEVENLRRTAALACRAAKIPPLPKVEIELHYQPRDKRRRDPQNIVPDRKAAEDGVVDAGVIPDDTPEFSVPLMPIIHPPNGSKGRVWLVIREVPPTVMEVLK